jgi:hypothetical protein
LLQLSLEKGILKYQYSVGAEEHTVHMKKSLAADSSIILLDALSINGNVVKSFLIIGFHEDEAIVILLEVSMILLDSYSTQSYLRFGVSIFASNIDRA